MPIRTRLFIADLTHLDCAYFDPATGLVGESWRVDAELGGELAADGMLCDFGVVKQVLKQALDAEIDHRLLLNAEQARQLEGGAEQCEITLLDDQGQEFRYRAPDEAFAVLDLPELQTTALGLRLSESLRTRLPENIQDLWLRLIPSHEQGSYRYCHGLRQHAGNCQRMAHGHRARLEIAIDNQRNAELERHWQQCLEGRYIGCADDLTMSSTRHRFAYRSSQGAFELELPARRSYVLDAEPTVESLSAHLAAEVAREHLGHTVQCLAFEGIGKGAVSCVGD